MQAFNPFVSRRNGVLNIEGGVAGNNNAVNGGRDLSGGKVLYSV